MSEFADLLGGVVRQRLGREVKGLRRLSGGAIQELYRLELDDDTPIILRRAPGGNQMSNVGLEAEAQVMTLALETGTPVPKILYVLQPEDGLGHGFLMQYKPGEGLGNRIVKDPKLATPRLAYQCGEAIAAVHRIDPDRLPAHLPTQMAADVVADYETRYRNYNWPRPVMEAAFAWLKAHTPPPLEKPLVVHGDYRCGNILIDENGVSAVLDWEIVHKGDPMEDLGWICTAAWRFGMVDKPVGGFGQREELWAGYEAAGGAKVERQHALFWELMGSVKWGIMCHGMTAPAIAAGNIPPIDRTVIARRASENEVDIMRLLDPVK